MTKFIEVIDADNGNEIMLNIDNISMIEQEIDEDDEYGECRITLKSDLRIIVVCQDISQIKERIQQSKQENPYRTK